MSYHNIATGTVIEIIPRRLIFSIERTAPRNHPNVFRFTIDNDEQFRYQPFYADFGPLSLLQVHIFLVVTLNHLDEHGGIIHFYCNGLPQNVANSVFLAACFRMICMQLPSDTALHPFSSLLATLKPYRDASSFPSIYDLSVSACVKGIERAMRFGWYNPESFDADSWAARERVENGDMNWLIPNKLLAFASPYHTNEVQGFRVCTPTDIVPVFRELGITNIVRLNNRTYDEQLFTDAGFTHTDLFFPDGTCPPDPILARFISLIEGSDVIALHCKAGLGRTGTLAGCHLIKNFGFSAAEAIGWIRVCRPGSIIGPQQHYLVKFWHRLYNRAPAPPPIHVRRNPRLAKPKPKTAGHSPQENKSPNRSVSLQVYSIPLTPQVPQPRKLNRARINTRRTPRRY